MKENPKRSLNKCKFKKNVDPKLNNLSSKNKMLFGDEWCHTSAFLVLEDAFSE